MIETMCCNIDREINKFYLGINEMRQGKHSTVNITRKTNIFKQNKP